MEAILKEILLKLEKLDTLENRFDNMENRFDNMENRFDNMENRFDNMENRFDSMENKLNSIENQVVSITEKQTETNQRLTKIETTIENNINVKIQALFEDRAIVHSKLDTITNELAVIEERIIDHDLKILAINKTRAI